MSLPDLTQPLTQAQFGSLVGISQQAVGNLVGRGVLDTSVPGIQLLQAYCSHLREQAAGRAANGDLDLATERAGLAREQKIRVALQNAEKQKQLLPAALLEEILAKAGARIAGIFDAIPGAVRRRVPSLPAEEITAIGAEIARARNIAASMSLADLRDDDAGGADDADEEEIEL
ncbi:phage terminase Nu1 subunit (DNA packaging protein) [Duganella sp. 1224]|uniref:terminase small subunit n=1 Tax=Duganella sp. 1224 TaxID=2587052 RepID=UPI0015CDCA78|nr:terminase small subunit [Duganella sp. 1224]NYE62201.1 phage terminase Nu1 subunit (DNA packaging protein) [Duganella sp. 1224]